MRRLLFLALSGCGLVLGLQDPTLLDDRVPVSGETSGLWTGGVLGLRLRATGAEDELLSVPANGAFTFQTRLAPGTGYVVSIESQPAAHDCVLEGASGSAGGTPVTARCQGPPVTVELAAANGFVFDPDVTSYTLDYSVALQAQAVRVSLPGAILALDDAPLADAVWSPSIPLDATPVTVRIDVATQGVSRRFELTFRRGGKALAQVVYGKASNPDFNDQFGSSAAVSDDTVVVGAPGEAGNGTSELNNDKSFSGAVYVFRRTGGVWRQEAYLKAGNLDDGDRFGDSVAISGDTIAVGAPQEDGSGGGVNPADDDLRSNSGAVYVFRRSGTTWTQEAYLKAWNSGEDDQFGYALSMSGDTIAVGTLSEDNGLTGIHPVVPTVNDETKPSSGAAYVFRRSGATWVLEAYLKASNSGQFDGFATTLAISGNTLVAGASGEDSGSVGVNDPDPGPNDDSAGNTGAAFIFERSGTTWTQVAYVKASNPDLFDNFGENVTVWGDTVVVGAGGEASAATGVNGNQENDDLEQAGAAYVFERTGGTWTQTAYLKASNPDRSDHFGTRLAAWRDVILVGSYDEASAATGVDPVSPGPEDDSHRFSGAVYVFRRLASGWVPVHYVKAGNSDMNDGFARGLAISADTVVVAAPGEAGAGIGINNTVPGPGDNSVVTGAFYLFH